MHSKGWKPVLQNYLTQAKVLFAFKLSSERLLFYTMSNRGFNPQRPQPKQMLKYRTDLKNLDLHGTVMLVKNGIRTSHTIAAYESSNLFLPKHKQTKNES